MKLRLLIVCIVAALVTLSAIGGGYAQDKDKGGGEGITQLYNAAKKEGTVIIWGPTDAIVYQRMQEALDKQYPGIKIRVLRKHSRAARAANHRRKPGRQARGRRRHSVRLVARAAAADRSRYAGAFPGWEKDFGLDAVYANQRFVGGYNLTLPIAYNTKMVSAQEAPKTWEDLADPKWKGRKIIIEARLVPFAMLGTEWGKGKAIELTKKILSQQQPLIVQGGTTVANALAGGQVSIAVGTYAFTIEGLKKQGAAVDWVAVSPLPVLTSAEGVLKTAAHPNAGRFFAGWMGTPEGQKIRYASRGQAMEVGRNAIGNVAERIKDPETGDHLGNR